jgi:ribose transport system substrate-binding protein
MKAVKTTPLTATLSLAAVALLATACSSSGSSGSGASTSTTTPASSSSSTSAASAGVQYAQAQVAKYEQVPAVITAPGPALTNESSLHGKAIWFIPLGIDIPYFAAVTAGAQQAASAAGVDLHVCDGNLNPSTITTCMNQAASSGASGVIADGFTTGFVQPAVNNLAAHHIPLVDADHAQGGGNDTLSYLGNNSYLQSELAADWIIANSNGKADILAVENTEDPVTSSFLTQGGLGQISKYCPACKVTIVKTTAEQLNLLPSALDTALLQNPGINYVFPEFDEDVTATIQGLDQSPTGKNEILSSATALLPDLQRIKDHSFQYADAGNNPAFVGWASLDQLMRMILKMQPIDNEWVPVRLFDSANIGSVTLTAAAFQSGAWYGNTTYQQIFESLWK